MYQYSNFVQDIADWDTICSASYRKEILLTVIIKLWLNICCKSAQHMQKREHYFWPSAASTPCEVSLYGDVSNLPLTATFFQYIQFDVWMSMKGTLLMVISYCVCLILFNNLCLVFKFIHHVMPVWNSSTDNFVVSKKDSSGKVISFRTFWCTNCRGTVCSCVYTWSIKERNKWKSLILEHSNLLI